MKNKILHIVLLLLLVLQAGAQKHTESKPFRAYLINNEYDVYLRINFYEQDVKVPGQELYGPLPGYLNDFGSEDLRATLTRKNDSLYVLKQGAGSTIKVPHQGKWRKLPGTLTFTRK